MTEEARHVTATLTMLKDAARAYVDATERGGGPPLAGLMAQARLRIAAKNFVHAERQALKVPS